MTASDETIDRAEVFVVGPDVDRYSWAEGMTGQYMANIIVKLTTKGGLEGLAGAAMITPHGFDRATGETLRHLLPDVLGRHFGERERLWHEMRNLGTPMVPQAQSLIDIALWDMTARYAGLPLHQLLGGARERILAYASTPLLADNTAYIDYIEMRRDEGFKAIKFHCWCNPLRDLPLCEQAANHFAGSGTINGYRYPRLYAFFARECFFQFICAKKFFTLHYNFAGRSFCIVFYIFFHFFPVYIRKHPHLGNIIT